MHQHIIANVAIHLLTHGIKLLIGAVKENIEVNNIIIDHSS